MRPRLGPAAVRIIEKAIETLFAKIRAHTFGDRYPQGKKLYVAYKQDLTLKGIFDAAATEERLPKRVSSPAKMSSRPC